MEINKITIDSIQYDPLVSAVVVSGWTIMAEDSESQIGLVLDQATYWATDYRRHLRDDVKAAYGSAIAVDEPGFSYSVKLTLTELLQANSLKIVTKTGTKVTTLSSYQKDEIHAEMLDYVLRVEVDEKKIVGNNAVILGWVMTSGADFELRVTNEAGDDLGKYLERRVRPDVCAIFPNHVNEADEIGFILRVPEAILAKGKIIMNFSTDLVVRELKFSRSDFPKAESLRQRLWEVARPSRWGEHLENIKKNGKEAFGQSIRGELYYSKGADYDEWFRFHRVSEKELVRQRRHLFAYQPTISIVIPLYNTPLDFLADILDSVCQQTYPHWQLCLADGSTNEEVANYIHDNYGDESRIIYHRLVNNGGISENTNQAIELATGDFIMFSDHDDTLELEALFLIVQELNESPQVDAVYTDEDKISMNGIEYYDPHFKPDFNLRMLRTVNYICHIFVVRKTIVDEVGLLRSEYDGAQDFDMVLRCCEKAREVRHIAKVLYHWRAHPQSTAGDPESKKYAYEAGRKAVAEQYNRLAIPATVGHTDNYGRYQTKFELIGNPKVSIIIVQKDDNVDVQACIDNLVAKTKYQNYEIIKSIDKNKATEEATGEYLLFLDSTMRIIDEDWLLELLLESMPKEVAIVGGKSYYLDETIRHAGLIVGLKGVVGRLFEGTKRSHGGYYMRAVSVQELSAVSSECMLIKKDVFRQIKGFDKQFSGIIGDADLCLRVRAAGYKVIFTPCATAYQDVNKKDISEVASKTECKAFAKKWKTILRDGDPYYNKNLSKIDQRATLQL